MYGIEPGEPPTRTLNWNPLGFLSHIVTESRIKIHNITPVTGKERCDLESHVHTTGQLTNTRSSDGAPDLDGVLREVDRKKILRYHQLYINRPDPIVFLPVSIDTTGRLYDDFSRLLFQHDHREVSTLTNEIPEESDQFRCLRVTFNDDILKGQWG
jgi:hypothetical protein